MLRRLALVVALLVPMAGLAQATATLQITPTAFGSSDCASTGAVTLTWTSPAVLATNDIYRLYVSNTSSCPTTGTPTGTLLGGADIAAISLTQSYPTTGTLTRQQFISDAGSTCATNDTIYVCFQHWTSGAGTLKAYATVSAKLEVLPPPVPVNVTAAPGDSALFVNWADGTRNPDGTTNIVAAASYNVTAVAIAPANPADTRTKEFTGKSARLDGLTNGVTYSVTVTAVSAGGDESLASVAATGTPQPVTGFWEEYTKDGGLEQGGCGGGPAGVVSLLGVALALRGLRRRS